MIPTTARRLPDLLIDPHETLDVELKEWLDIVGNGDHKAIIAKALIALANHGGGYLMMGFAETDQGMTKAGNRPARLSAYNPDVINSIVNAYAEPAFHCDVNIVAAPDGLQYPIIAVPGGHHVPIKAKRDGPNGQIVKQNSYYIRRPGPQSEMPQNGREWDALIRRCIGNARGDLVNQMRAILQGGVGTETPEDDRARATKWLEESLSRWNEVVGTLQPNSSARFPHGHFAVGYVLSGDLNRLGLNEVLEALNRGTIRHTGWPEFWVPTREEIRPYIRDGNIECWMVRDGKEQGTAHSDFWRASPSGSLFLIRGHEEDDARHHGTPGTRFDITLPAWRVGEGLLHASNMAMEFGDVAAQVTFVVEWTGLAGRSLTHLERRRLVVGEYRTQESAFRTNLTV